MNYQLFQLRTNNNIYELHHAFQFQFFSLFLNFDIQPRETF